jgi:uncharacterized protein (TIGR00255 family)
MSRPILSMTGFGRGQGECPAGRVVAEVRSLNSRFLEVFVKSPREFLFFDPEARRLVRERASRGKVEVFLSIERAGDRPLLTPERAARLNQQLSGLAALVGGRVTLGNLLSAAQMEGVTEAVDGEALGHAAATALGAALGQFVAHRETEGRALAADIRSRIARVRELRDAMTPLAAKAPERVMRQVADFLQRWELASKVDPPRLEAEVALLAQRADITEELTRLATHLVAMDEALARGEGAGRRLDFLLQEAGREVNTVGSKASDSDLASLVVEAKSELEKVREQVQNLE